MNNKIIIDHKNKITEVETYIAELKQTSKTLSNSIGKNKNDAKSFVKDQETRFKLDSVNSEIRRAEEEHQELLSSKDLFKQVEQELIMFRKLHFTDSHEINKQIISKINEIKELKKQLQYMAQDLTNEMTELIEQSSEYLPETIVINNVNSNSLHSLTTIANGNPYHGGLSLPIMEKVDVQELLK